MAVPFPYGKNGKGGGYSYNLAKGRLKPPQRLPLGIPVIIANMPLRRRQASEHQKEPLRRREARGTRKRNAKLMTGVRSLRFSALCWLASLTARKE